MDVLDFFAKQYERNWVHRSSVPPVLTVTAIREEHGQKMVGDLVRAGGRREQYREMRDYDPVLRAHCRMEEK